MPMHRLDCSCTPRHSQLWSHLRLGERGLTTSRSSIVHLLSFIMNFNIQPSFRTSSAVECMTVNPVRGTASVTYKKGYTYDYTNVSRRAILNLLANPNMSLGFWVNNNLLFCDSKCAQHGTYSIV
jgi:hypothetical protein